MILPAVEADHFFHYTLLSFPLLFSRFHSTSSFHLRYAVLSCRNRSYSCKEIHIFKQDQKNDKRPAVHILHCKKCQDHRKPESAG